jgi:hypothetical protein
MKAKTPAKLKPRRKRSHKEEVARITQENRRFFAKLDAQEGVKQRRRAVVTKHYTYYCPRCGAKEAWDCYHKEVPNQPSGFIAGHWGNNPDAPVVGLPVWTSRTRFATFCKQCGEEVRELLTEAQRKERNKAAREASWPPWAIGSIIIFALFLLVAFILAVLGVT